MTDIRLRLEKKARADFENAMNAFHAAYPMPVGLKITYHGNILNAPRGSINQFEEYKGVVMSYVPIKAEYDNLMTEYTQLKPNMWKIGSLAFDIQKLIEGQKNIPSDVSNAFPMVAGYDENNLNYRTINIINALCGRYKKFNTEFRTKLQEVNVRLEQVKCANERRAQLEAERKASSAAATYAAEERLIAEEAERRFKEMEREAKIQAKVAELKYAAELASLFP